MSGGENGDRQSAMVLLLALREMQQEGGAPSELATEFINGMRKCQEKDEKERKKKAEYDKKNAAVDDEEANEEEASISPTSWHPHVLRASYIQRAQISRCQHCSCSHWFDCGVPSCLLDNWREVLIKLKYNEITTLDLAGGIRSESDEIKRFKIGDHIQLVHELTEALKINKSLTSLDLSANDLTDEGVSRLAAVLLTHRTLNKLVLEENYIGDEGAGELSDVLERNTCITALYLGRNFIGDEGRLKIGQALLTRARPQQEYLIKNEQTRHCKKGGLPCENHHRSKRKCLVCFPAICANPSCGGAVKSRHHVVCVCARVVFCRQHCQQSALGARAHVCPGDPTTWTPHLFSKGMKIEASPARVVDDATHSSWYPATVLDTHELEPRYLVKWQDASDTTVSPTCVCESAQVRALSQPLDAGGNSENNGSASNAAIESWSCSSAHNKKAAKKKPPASSEEVECGGGAAALPACHELILRGINLWQVAPLLGVPADVPAMSNENMVRFLRAQEERRTAVCMLLHVRLGQRSMWSLLDQGLLRMVLAHGLHNENDLCGDADDISIALVLSEAHLARRSLEQLKLLAVEREVKREGVGWAASCPPAGSKSDIFRAILRAQEVSQDSQYDPSDNVDEDEDEDAGEGGGEEEGEEEEGEEGEATAAAAAAAAAALAAAAAPAAPPAAAGDPVVDAPAPFDVLAHFLAD